MIRQQQDAKLLQVVWQSEILKLHGRYRHAAFEQRQGQTIDVAQVGIAWLRLPALEHERIADDQPDARRAAVPLHAPLVHVVECVDDRLDLSRVFRRHRLAFPGLGPRRITPPKYALRPRRYLELPDIRLEQRCHHRGFPVDAIVCPVMVRVVLNWVVQEPDPAARAPHQVHHSPVFQERGLEGALTALAAKHVRRSGGAGPDLRDVAVTALQPRQAGFRADNAPVGVVEQAMRGHIAAHLSAGPVVVVLHVVKHLLQGAPVEIILELGSAPLGVHRTVRRLPVLMVISAPLALEALRIAATHPELRLLQVDRLRARVQRALDPHA